MYGCTGVHRDIMPVNRVPVDYPLWFSDLVTPPCPLTVHRPPRPAWRPHLPGRPFASYKDALVPRRFSNNYLPPPFPPGLSAFLLVP
jgi:hypothetical protein